MLKAPKNDHLNLSFVKDINMVGKKWPEMVLKQSFMTQFWIEAVYNTKIAF